MMYKLIPVHQKLVPLVKQHGPILLPHKGKMVLHYYSKKLNKLVPNDNTP